MDKSVIERIKKLLSLAGNNPNENEAMAAALKAQALMAQYNIEIDQLEDREVRKEIVEEYCHMESRQRNMKWRYNHASIIAKNFKCKTFFHGRDTVFYGYKDDAAIAKEVFTFLFEVGNKLALEYYNRARRDGRETAYIMNTYLTGYVEGLNDVLGRQCVALMIVTPKEVEDSFKIRSKGFGHINTGLSCSSDRRAFNDGRTDGRSTANARSIEGQRMLT